MNTFEPAPPTKGTNGQSYEWHLDIAAVLAGGGTPTYMQCPDITALNPNGSPKTADGTTYANRGQDDISTIGETFTVGYDTKVVKNAEGTVAPYLALLISAAQANVPGGDPSKKVIKARVYHEWIEEFSYEFTAEVSMQRKNTGNADTEFLSFTLTSKGDRKIVPNPALATTP